MGQPNVVVLVACVGFLLVVAACFSSLAPRRAVLAAMLGGWLFLPHFDSGSGFDFLVFHSKAALVPGSVLLGSLVFDGVRWRRLRLRLLDVPVLVLCLSPFATALDNGLGVYEGVAASVDVVLTWGSPYLLGRAYLGDADGPRDFAVALVVAALAYVPLSLWEIRMSPQIHQTVYGYRPFGFEQSLRFGGWRPSVFMQHGLALGLFMASGTLSAFWLWRSGARAQVAGLPTGWAFLVLGATTLLAKSIGSILLLATGMAVLEATRSLRSSALLAALALAPPAYCAARMAGWNAASVISLSGTVVNLERAESIRVRVESEKRLIAKAVERPWLGWGRFGRSFVYDEEGRRSGEVITDSLWIIVVGVAGIVGLGSLGLMLAAPPLALLRAGPAARWAGAPLAPAAALAVVLLLWTIDQLVNAMLTPVYPAIAGALVSYAGTVRAARARRPRAGTLAPARAAQPRWARSLRP